MSSARLEAFNATDHDTALSTVLGCADVARWADQVVEGRPYASVAEALDRARSVANPWTESEVDSALARHPRIGERAQGDAADAEHSRQEQAGLTLDEDGVAARLVAGNRAYEDRFGHVFLIRAAGRSAEEILTRLEERLTNDADTERRIAAEQLREIAVLRLEGVLA